MTPSELDTFLARTHNAIVAVNRPGKAPHLTPVWYLWDGTVFRFSTTRDRAKYFNIRRDPLISLIIDDAVAHAYVVASGPATIIEENVAALTHPIMDKYRPPPPGADPAARPPLDATRVIVELRPDRLLVRPA